MTRITAPWLTSAPAQTVCKMFTDAGYQAWFVGGCVRNALLGAPVSDLDLSTDAHPEQTLTLAKSAGLKAIPTGLDHGTITVVADGTPFEITTYRKDIATDGRRATVAFADNMTDDAKRRDFTMNALYCGPDGTVADPLNGLPDLQTRHVRFIEDPDQRIKEDYLRILRFFRFHAWYGDAEAGVDADGLAACAANVEGIASLSRERITQELLKLLAAPNPAPSVASFASTGGLPQALPGANAGPLAPLIHHEESLGLEPDPVRRLAIIGGENPSERLRLSKAQTRLLDIYRSGDDPITTAYQHDATIGRGMLALNHAMSGQPIDPTLPAKVDDAADQTFPLRADDLRDRYQGPALGKALRAAEAKWIASDFTLTKDDLLG